ncbi:hypothetical protein M885DRAFT_501204 [Pelagophyceae sp. CCMP2097]|nr:hypothetical protein M885DRAFT_501204 [Pelagophyceae sp. CCMP2097]
MLMILRGPSFHAVSRRIEKGVKMKPPGRREKTQIFYSRNADGTLCRTPHSAAELEQLRDARDAKLTTQLLLIVDVIISARTNGRRVGVVSFLLSLVVTSVGKLTQFAQTFATCLAVTSSHVTSNQYVRTVQARWKEHYRAQLAATAAAGYIFIFDNYAYLQFLKTPGALGVGLASTIPTITMLVKGIPFGKPAKLSVDPDRLPAMERALSLKSFTVLPSLSAKSSSIKDTAFVVLAFIHDFCAVVGDLRKADQIITVDSEPFNIFDRLSVIVGMYKCVSSVFATLAPFHLQKHLLENYFCDPHKFVYFWAPMLVMLDYRAEHMVTTSRGMKTSLGVSLEAPEFEEEEDEDALGRGDDGAILEIHSALGVAPVEHTHESLLAARIDMQDEDGEDAEELRASEDGEDAEEPRAAAAGPKTCGVSHKEKSQTKVKYERLLFISQLLFVVWSAGSAVDNCGLREAVVDKTREAYRNALLGTVYDDERTAWIIHDDALPVHAHLGAYVLLVVYNVNAKNWKAAKTPRWVISYLGQTLYRWFGKDGKNRQDVIPALGCICKSINDVFVENTNSIMRRSIQQHQTVTFEDIQAAATMIGPIRAISKGLRTMTGSTAKASKSELERNEDRAKGPRFSEARRKVGAELLRMFIRALEVAAGLKAAETAREPNAMEVGFESLPAIVEHMAATTASSKFAEWPETRGPRRGVAERPAVVREKAAERAKEHSKLQGTLTHAVVKATKATDLLKMAKTCCTPDEWRTMDEKTGKWRQLKKVELVELFLEKFGLAARPGVGAESAARPSPAVARGVATVEPPAAVARHDGTEPDAEPPAAAARHGAADTSHIASEQLFAQHIRDERAAWLRRRALPTSLDGDPEVRLTVWRFGMSSIKTRRGQNASSRLAPAGSPIRDDGIIGRRGHCRAGIP